jgi:hypothetical protein
MTKSTAVDGHKTMTPLAMTRIQRWAVVGVAAAAVLGAEGCIGPCRPCTAPSSLVSAPVSVIVTGRIVDPEGTLDRIRLAFIRQGDEPTLTKGDVNPDGTFRLELPAGPYRVELYRLGHPDPRAVFVKLVSSLNRDFTLHVPETSPPSP